MLSYLCIHKIHIKNNDDVYVETILEQHCNNVGISLQKHCKNNDVALFKYYYNVLNQHCSNKQKNGSIATE